MRDTERSATTVGDAGLDRLTEPSRYRFQFSQSQDGSVLLVLDPPSLDEGNGD